MPLFKKKVKIIRRQQIKSLQHNIVDYGVEFRLEDM